jgi:hypothetical protein
VVILASANFWAGITGLVTAATSLVIAIKSGRKSDVTKVKNEATQAQVDRITDHIINGGRAEDIISKGDND